MNGLIHLVEKIERSPLCIYETFNLPSTTTTTTKNSDTYAPLIGQSALLDDLLNRLHRALRQEVKLQRELTTLLGSLDLLLATQENQQHRIERQQLEQEGGEEELTGMDG